MSWLKGLGTRARLLFGRAAESRMEEEMRFHLEMEAERLARDEGLDAAEAARRARVVFGGQEKYREEMREGRGLAWLSGLRLDLKLGVRMLLKYPVLTLGSVLVLTIAVGLAASWFEFGSDLSRPRIPLPEGDRLVQVRNRDLAAGATEPRMLHDFEVWREQARSIEDLSAASAIEYNLTTEGGRFAVLRGSRVTHSTFRAARVQPVLGRPLTSEDYHPAAAPVVVIGYGVWQRVFDGERSAVGQTVRLGTGYATVVGVMPEGFAFPVNQEIWTPLRENPLSYDRRAGPRLVAFGRLAPGATLEEARAELETIGRRIAAEFPVTNEHLRPDVIRLGRGSDEAAIATLLNLPFILFLVVVSANVATLLFARTATREGEIALRSALGASRRRIILQLVAESLVLTSVAAALGLAAAHWGLRWGMNLFWQVQQSTPPFWFDPGLSAPTALYVLALAALGAFIIGGIPGIRATGRRLRHRLTQAGSGGAGMRFGPIATGVIVVQVALCVAFLPVAIMNGQELLPERRDSSFPAETFLSGRITRQPDAARPAGGERAANPVDGQRAAELFDTVRRRLASESGVLALTRASRLPGFNHPMEVVEILGDSIRIDRVRRVAIDPDFFDVMSARIVRGRAFSQGDATGSSDVAIVGEAWAQESFGGRNPIGQRIRFPARAGEEAAPWHEIVGVVADMEPALGPAEDVAVYQPLRPAGLTSVQMYVRTAGLPAALAPRVGAVVATLDPSLGIADLMSLEEVWRPAERSNAFFAAALSVVAAIILLFALIGIYSLMSFTVTQRAREIGIRAALGADSRKIILSIFSRALLQIGLGIAAGAALVSLTVARNPDGLRLVAGVSVAMAAMGLVGCFLPAARALRIQPVQALRAE